MSGKVQKEKSISYVKVNLLKKIKKQKLMADLVFSKSSFIAEFFQR